MSESEDVKYIGGTVRADGSIRKSRKVRPGFVPQEEVPKYVPIGRRRALGDDTGGLTPKVTTNDDLVESMGKLGIKDPADKEQTNPARFAREGNDVPHLATCKIVREGKSIPTSTRRILKEEEPLNEGPRPMRGIPEQKPRPTRRMLKEEPEGSLKEERRPVRTLQETRSTRRILKEEPTTPRRKIINEEPHSPSKITEPASEDDKVEPKASSTNERQTIAKDHPGSNEAHERARAKSQKPKRGKRGKMTLADLDAEIESLKKE